MVAWLILRLIRGIDWREVTHAVTHLAAWQAVLLLLLACLRLAILGGPLTLLIDGLGYRRALQNEVTAAAVATIAPDPSDVMLRLAMFRSWAIETTAAASGIALRTTIFYVLRLAAPVLGFIIFWATRSYQATFAWFAVLSGTAAVLLLGGLLFALRAASTAAMVGRLLGRILRRLRPAAGGPEEWSERLVGFQSHTASTMRERGALAGLLLLGFLMVETTVVVLGVAFVGGPPEPSAVLVIACCFLVVYPMTGLPMMGLGVLDATLVAFVTDHSTVVATDVVAGLVLWRLAVQFVPVIIGLATLAWWRRSAAVGTESRRLA
ncbi:hypothetical protein GCM10009789_10680 [Kribbella sancticallisti]|uniref:Lysylphosphatidylglycerol synthase TM region n=1 Tax=Kribbella sancticallisti TaxID=460087 RepID=A0ABP4NEI0_9ACTN